jgi:membrane-associated phospholipid phosphatase
VAETLDRPISECAAPTRPVEPAPAVPDAPVDLPVPTAEVRVLSAVQRAVGRQPVVRAARGLSLFGEHAGGWLLVGAAGALADRRRRRDWLVAAAGVAAAHGASVAVKRVVRRRRPADPRVRVLVGTPSSLSFPSAHSTSTTAAALLYGPLLGRRLAPLLVPPMAVSRLVLGVHYPTDVAAGAALGAAVAAVTPRAARRFAR